MKVVVELPVFRAPRPITSFEKHYNSAEHLMPNEPLDMGRVMHLPTRPWYRRIWTWVTRRNAK